MKLVHTTYIHTWVHFAKVLANRSRVYEAKIEEPNELIAGSGLRGVFIVRVSREQRREPAEVWLAKDDGEPGEEIVKRSTVNVFKSRVLLV